MVLIKILIYLPLNDSIGIYACMRYSIEQFIKFIYSIYFEKEIDKINKTSYRFIKDDINGNTLIQDKLKSELRKIYTYYAKYSNDIHNKKIIYDDNLNFLGDILTMQNNFCKDIDTDLSTILLITYTIIKEIFNIHYEDFCASERSQFQNLTINRHRKEKILTILSKN